MRKRSIQRGISWFFWGCLFLFQSEFRTLASTEPHDVQWSVAIYLSSEAPNLSYDLKKFNEILEIGMNNPTLHLAVLFDGIDQSTFLTVIHQGVMVRFESFDSEVNFGEAATLRTFLEDSGNSPEEAVLFPSRYQALILGGDGGQSNGNAGWMPAPGTPDFQKGAPVGFGYDSGSHLDGLMIWELKQALEGYHFDVLAFDACFMGSTEVFYELRDFSEILVGSESRIQSTVFAYSVFNSQNSAFQVSPAQLATALVHQTFSISDPWMSQMIAVQSLGLARWAEAFSERVREFQLDSDAKGIAAKNWRPSSLLTARGRSLDNINVDLERFLAIAHPFEETIDSFRNAILARGGDRLRGVLREIHPEAEENEILTWAKRLGVELQKGELSREEWERVVYRNAVIPPRFNTRVDVYWMLELMKRFHQRKLDLFWGDGISFFLPIKMSPLQKEIYQTLEFDLRVGWSEVLQKVTNWTTKSQKKWKDWDDESKRYETLFPLSQGNYL